MSGRVQGEQRRSVGEASVLRGPVEALAATLRALLRHHQLARAAEPAALLLQAPSRLRLPYLGDVLDVFEHLPPLRAEARRLRALLDSLDGRGTGNQLTRATPAQQLARAQLLAAGGLMGEALEMLEQVGTI